MKRINKNVFLSLLALSSSTFLYTLPQERIVLYVDAPKADIVISDIEKTDTVLDLKNTLAELEQIAVSKQQLFVRPGNWFKALFTSQPDILIIDDTQAITTIMSQYNTAYFLLKIAKEQRDKKD